MALPGMGPILRRDAYLEAQTGWCTRWKRVITAKAGSKDRAMGLLGRGVFNMQSCP